MHESIERMEQAVPRVQTARVDLTNLMMEDIRQSLQQEQYSIVEKLATELIQIHPHAAQAWVYLGEALLHQGYGGAAKAVFNRAWLLDPQATWVEAVEAAVAKVAAAGPILAELGEVAESAAHIDSAKAMAESAAQIESEKIAMHATNTSIEELLALNRITVAAAIITRNESRSIVRCVHSLADAVDEIVIIDSDSTDGTIELVEHLPKVKIVRHVLLNGHFAEKRNQGLSYIESDWVLWIDADEWLEAEDVPAVREVAALFHQSEYPVVLNICQVNHILGKQFNDYSVPRMFALHRGLCYYGRIHEQVVVQGKGVFDSEILRHSVRIRLHHDGYEPHIIQLKNKLNRNLDLLKMMVADEPDNPGWLFFYGRETLGVGDVEQAMQILLEAEQKGQHVPKFGRMLDIQMYLYKIYKKLNNLEQAEAVCRRALTAVPNYPDALYYLAQLEMTKAIVLLQQAEQNLQQSKQAFTTYRGTVPANQEILDWRADLTLADLARITGKSAEAKQRYEHILQRHPGLDAVRQQLERL